MLFRSKALGYHVYYHGQKGHYGVALLSRKEALSVHKGFASDEEVYKDSAGTVLTDGDTITVIKDLKIKGTSLVVKVGTKVKNIRLCDGDHDIDCKIDGIGPMKLKSEFVRKV